ncbi:crotonobetainyl-CoA:carnitine CoA-transferase CaiB-like acyl-CoA transferase [Humitalea rosea]|uniref:Crotonobetainyl-CoA:carnitine CoA-transferase CaiB-like acyl-CoA transferase n=1 Tax=Humitalea rosea TaxID=990373 RepID=A0A2W7HWM7_9PROT|nr:CoA transferase [Humitalea rosea]PZW38894.1 crotonobetainyl-CoA:carnitine CoA-transferase CaiB-like acyl-CoA transferase [Humitalea rosea]
MSGSALQGVRVLDLGQGIAGPFAARLLGDFGAEVIKVEPPGGDEARQLPPLMPDAPEAERSLLFRYINWNKRGITLDLESPEGRRTLQDLVRRSDIVIESFPPGTLAGMGFSSEQMIAWQPRLVVTSVTDFGQTGPYAHYAGSDLVLQAMSGIMQISGEADRAPLKHGLSQAYFCGGLNAAYASLAAFHAAERDGIGDHVDLSIQECLISELVISETYYSFMGAVQGRRYAVEDPFSGAPIPTRKGYIAIQAGGSMPPQVYADLFGNEAFRDPKFASNRQRALHLQEASALMRSCVKDRDAKDIFLDGSRRRLLMGMVQTAPDLLACEQLAARDFFAELSHPAGGTFRYPVELAKLSATPVSVRRPAPLLGEHTAEVLAELATPAAEVAPAPAGARARLPLEGLRVLDMATVVAVPYMAALLGDLGAEVIKIEAPHKLDPTRQGVLTTYLDNDTRVDAINRSGIWQVVNRGKQSLVLDMSQPEGKAIFRDLVAKSDIIVDNFPPRVMAAWGLDHDALKAINPGIIWLTNTGYGSTGPWRNFPSQGTTLEVTMGIASYSGYRGGKPSKVGHSYPDFLACWIGLAALFAALRHRRLAGEGQRIDLGMYQVGVAMIPEALLQYQLDGTEPQRIGNEHEEYVPSDAFPCRGDDRWVTLTVKTDSQWQALAALMARDGIAVDPGLGTAVARRERRAEVNDLVGRWTPLRDGLAVMRLLQEHGVASGPVFSNRDLLLNDHLAARGFYERVRLPEPMGLRPMMGRPWKLSRRLVKVGKPAPRYGEDGPQILRDLLGLDASQIERLLADRVVCLAPTVSKPIDAMGIAELLRLKAIHDVDKDYREKLGIADAATNAVV